MVLKEHEIVSPLRRFRLEKGLRLEDVARMLGITAGQVSKHERGEIELTGVYIDRYRKLYKVSAKELFVTKQT